MSTTVTSSGNSRKFAAIRRTSAASRWTTGWRCRRLSRSTREAASSTEIEQYIATRAAPVLAATALSSSSGPTSKKHMPSACRSSVENRASSGREIAGSSSRASPNPFRGGPKSRPCRRPVTASLPRKGPAAGPGAADPLAIGTTLVGDKVPERKLFSMGCRRLNRPAVRIRGWRRVRPRAADASRCPAGAF